jgi:hypothetical protein
MPQMLAEPQKAAPRMIADLMAWDKHSALYISSFFNASA